MSACAYGWLSPDSGGIGKGTDTAALHPAGGTDSSHIVSVQKQAVSNAGARALQRPVCAVRVAMGTVWHCVGLRVWLAVARFWRDREGDMHGGSTSGRWCIQFAYRFNAKEKRANAGALASQRPVLAVLAGMGTVCRCVGLRVWLAVA